MYEPKNEKSLYHILWVDQPGAQQPLLTSRSPGWTLHQFSPHPLFCCSLSNAFNIFKCLPFLFFWKWPLGFWLGKWRGHLFLSTPRSSCSSSKISVPVLSSHPLLSQSSHLNLMISKFFSTSMIIFLLLWIYIGHHWTVFRFFYVCLFFNFSNIMCWGGEGVMTLKCHG